MFLLLGLMCLCASSGEASEISRVFFKQANGLCVFRNVYDPHGYFKAYTATSGISFYVTGQLASEEVYDYVITLQKQLPELPQIPIIVRTISSGYFTHCCFDNPNNKAICYFDVTIDDKPLDPWRKFFLGHELGHFAYSATHAFYAKRNAESRFWIYTANWCQQYLIGALVLSELGALQSLFLGEDESLWRMGMISLITLIAIVRIWGYSVSGGCHDEELYCDQFALKTASNKIQKAAMLAAAKNYFSKRNISWWDTIKNMCDALVFTSTHPANAYRIQHFDQSEIG